MKFNKNKSRISLYLKVKNLRTEKKGVGQFIAYTLTRIVIALSEAKFSKLSNIKFYNYSKYKILQFRSIKKLLIHFFVFITLVYKVHFDHHLTNSSNSLELVF